MDTITECFVVIVGMIVMLSLVGISNAAEESRIFIGWSCKDITPEKPVKMSGYSGRANGTKLSEGVYDHLYARVVAFENNGKKLVLISSDLIGFYDETYDYFQKNICNEFNLKQSELILAGIHTHAGPILTVNKEKGHPNNLEYTETLKNKFIQVIREAFENMRPAKTGVGVGYCPIAINRRDMKSDGSMKIGRNPYGVTDKEVLVMKLAKQDNSTMGVLFDFACHAT